MAEWSKATVSKIVLHVCVTWVRIPLSPPFIPFSHNQRQLHTTIVVEAFLALHDLRDYTCQYVVSLAHAAFGLAFPVRQPWR